MREDVTDTIDPQHREEFCRFIENGEASEDFLAYMDESEECQRAIEQVFAREAAQFEELTRSLALWEASKSSGRSLSSTAAVPLRRRSWRGAYPYAMAASLVLALLAGFLAWNFASVARHEEHRATQLAEQYSGVLLDRDASQQRLEDLQKRLAEVQEKIAQEDLVGTENRSELSRLRKQKAELEKALASEQARTKATERKPVEDKIASVEGTPPSGIVVQLQPDEVKPSPPIASEAVEERIVEAPKFKPQVIQLPSSFAFNPPLPDREVPLQVLIRKNGDVADIQFSRKLSNRVRLAVEFAVKNTDFQPGTRNGEPQDMWKNLKASFPETGESNSAVRGIGAVQPPPD